MTSKEFVLWMKGFAVGSSKFNLTPEGWDELKSQLEKVNDDVIPMGGLLTDYNRFGTVYPNWSGINPYETKGPETPTGTRITTTPGYGGITFSGSYNPSTSTTYGYPSGSAWSYTNSTDEKIF